MPSDAYENSMKHLDHIYQELVGQFQAYRASLLTTTPSDLIQTLMSSSIYSWVSAEPLDRDIAAISDEINELSRLEATCIASSRANECKKMRDLQREARINAFKGSFMNFDANKVFFLSNGYLGKFKFSEQEMETGKLEKQKQTDGKFNRLFTFELSFRLKHV